MKKRNPPRKRKSGEPKHTEFEPRHYTPEDESFARRLRAGFKMMKGSPRMTTRIRKLPGQHIRDIGRQYLKADHHLLLHRPEGTGRLHRRPACRGNDPHCRPAQYRQDLPDDAIPGAHRRSPPGAGRRLLHRNVRPVLIDRMVAYPTGHSVRQAAEE